MELLSLKTTSDRLLLCLLLSILGAAADTTTTTAIETISTTATTPTIKPPPENTDEFVLIGQNETSITLQWKKVADLLNYRLVFDDKQINITASAADQVTHTVSGLTSGTRYVFTLFTVLENVRSSGVELPAVTAPEDTEQFVLIGQDETSITLQWKKVADNLNYTLVYNGTEEDITAPSADPVTHTVSGLTSGTSYFFTLFTVLENVRSSGVNLSAVTAPRKAEGFVSIGQDETSITLQWRKVADNLNYTLVYHEKEINITAPSADPVTHTVSGLTSGTRYHFTLFTVLENITSSGANLSAVTAPRKAEGFVSIGQDETSITLQWRKVADNLNYTLVYNEKEINITEPAADPVTHTVSGLTSGTRYNFTLFTVFGNITSSGVELPAVTAPRKAEGFVSIGQNETSITLQWRKVADNLNYTLVYNETEINILEPAADPVTHTVSGLSSGTRYLFTLFTVLENVRSIGFNHSAVTAPTMVPFVNVTERAVTSITLKWTNMDPNWRYFVIIDGRNITVEAYGFSNVVSHPVTSLRPGTKYPFSVVTTFSGVHSTNYTGFTVTAIDCTTVTWHVTRSSIQATIEGLFSTATATNGSNPHVSPGGGNVSFTGLYPGATYELSLVYEKNSIHFLQCRHRLTTIPPELTAHCEYWASGYSVFIVWDKPDGVWTTVEVNVTGKTHRVSEEEQQIKISGFKPARTYEVSIAALSGTVKSYKPYVFQCPTDPRGVIAGSVFGVLIFAVLVCLAVFILLKRPDIIRRKKSFIGGFKSSTRKLKDISAAKFPDHVYQMSLDENRGFSQEYQSLTSVGTEQTQHISVLPDNSVKNRFSNVLPYDWSRVKLSTSDPNVTSDYINANYLPGYNSNHDYIATQGPLPSTVSDFWRMIWEQRVNGIVMVANCMEGGRTKCEQYWPKQGEPCLHGQLLVTITSERQEPNWTSREFRVKNSDTSEERTVKHFHFTAWPDHGVPEGTDVLIQFRALVRRHIDREGTGSPTVVHCSAGVGRTGTIIALDVLLQQLDSKKEVGVNAFVHKMRLRRPYMVQTESQYVFLHQCILDCLQPIDKNEENIYENSDMIYVNATALRELR